MILCNLILIQLALGVAMIIIVIFGKLVMYLHDKKECKHQFNQDDVINLKIDHKCVKCGKELSKCN